MRGKGSVEQIARLTLFALLGALVSVPLRGKGSVEQQWEIAALGYSNAVSVPLRGKGSVELILTHTDLVVILVSFRPLAGKGFC